MSLSMNDKLGFVDKMAAVVEECENGLKRRAEGRFRPKSLCYAIDPRMVSEVRGYFDNVQDSGSDNVSVQRFDGLFASLGETVKMTFTPHLDGSVYVTGKELTRMRTLIEQCKSLAITSNAA